MAIELWTALRVHGEAWFGAVVDRLFELADLLAARVRAAPDFELALEPDANIVVYRMRGVDNRALRRKVVEDGRRYIVGTELAGDYWLRSTLMNPLIEPEDLDALLEHLRAPRSKARGLMPRVTIRRAGDPAGDLVAECPTGESLFDAGARVSGGDRHRLRGGRGTCRAVSRAHHRGRRAPTSVPADEERKHLGNVYHITKVRLSCRCKVTGDVVVEVVRKPAYARKP